MDIASAPAAVIDRAALSRPGLSPSLSAIESARLLPRMKGSAGAGITVLELSDFQCEDCRRFSRETFPLLKRRYVDTGQVRWVFLNWPKAHKHAHAVRAAEFALCAAEQDRFWDMHDALFDAFELWSGRQAPDAVFDALAVAAGLDMGRLALDLASGHAARELAADAQYVARWEATLVPSFNIRGAVITGARTAEYLAGYLDAWLHAP